jgi:hypothetical protein
MPLTPIDDDPTQPPPNPVAPVLRDEGPLSVRLTRLAAADFAEGIGEPPD